MATMSPPASTDPATGCPLPPDAIVRVLHITPKVHIYSVPRDDISTAAGYAAASWTADPRSHIFTARLRVLETSFTVTHATTPSSSNNNNEEEDTHTQLKVDILLEDPSSGTLFAAAPYTTPATVEPTKDSSRFFAVRVQDPTGKQKATLGVGFEERSEAFDFGVALQEAGRALNWASSSQVQRKAPTSKWGPGGEGGGGGEEEKNDLSLKEGETITVNLSGTRFGRRVGRSTPTPTPTTRQDGKEGEELQSLASFALPPPPGSSSSSSSARAQKRLSAQQLGFDDGQFGEFA